MVIKCHELRHLINSLIIFEAKKVYQTNKDFNMEKGINKDEFAETESLSREGLCKILNKATA